MLSFLSTLKNRSDIFINVINNIYNRVVRCFFYLHNFLNTLQIKIEIEQFETHKYKLNINFEFCIYFDL